MEAGDLVSLKLLPGMGILLRLISDDPIVGEKFWLVQWSDGVRDTTRERFLEVINASR